MITQLLVLKNKAPIILVFLIPFLKANKHFGSRISSWTLLVVQWLRLCAPTAGGSSLTLGCNVWPNKKFFKNSSHLLEGEKRAAILCVSQKKETYLPTYSFKETDQQKMTYSFHTYQKNALFVFKILMFHKQRKIHARFLNYHCNAECTHKSLHDTKRYTLKSL